MTNANTLTDVVGVSATERKSRFRSFTVAAGVTLAVALAALLALVAFPGPAAAQAQIDVAALIRSIVCPILTALANGPLGDFIRPIINSLLAAFGCGTISG